MKEALSHILDQSVCLTRRQMKEYLAGTMLREEQHAAELHLASCPLCSMAMEGFEEHSEEALAAIASLNSGFLKEHYDAVTPQIHLNSVAPVMTASLPRKKGAVQPLWRNLGIAAGILLIVGAFWLMRAQKEEVSGSKVLADNTLPSSAPVTTGAPVLAAAPQVAPAAKQQPDKPHANTKPAVMPVQASEKAVSSSGALAMADKPSPAAPVPSKIAADESVGLKSNTLRDSTSAVVALGPNVQAGGRGSDVIIGGGRTSGNNVSVDRMAYQSNAYSTTSTTTMKWSTPPATAYSTTPQLRKFSKPLAAPPAGRNYYTRSAPPPGAAAKEKAREAKKENAAAALQLKDKMESSDGTRRSRHIAGIQSAKAYMAAGQKAKAIAVLNQIIAEGGPQKKAAKKLLKELQR